MCVIENRKKSSTLVNTALLIHFSNSVGNDVRNVKRYNSISDIELCYVTLAQNIRQLLIQISAECSTPRNCISVVLSIPGFRNRLPKVVSTVNVIKHHGSN